MKKHKLLGLILAGVLAISFIAGCAADTSETSAPTDGTNGGNETTTEPSETQSTEAQDLVIFMPFANTSTDEGLEDTAAALEEAMAEDGLYLNMEWIVIPRDNFEEVLNVTLLSNDQQLDGALGDMDDLGSASQKTGLVVPIDSYLQEYGQQLLEKIPESAWENVKNSKGEIVGIPSYNRYFWQGAVIRQDWLDELGLEMPETLEDLENVMEQFKTLGDDIIPISGPPWYLEAVLMAAVTGNVSPAVDNFWDTLDESGERVINGFAHPKWKNFLQLYHKWLENGWLNRDFNVADDQQNEQMFTSGKLGIMFNDPHNADRYEQILKETDPEAEVGFLPIPSGPAGEAAFPQNTGISRVIWVAQKSPEPANVVKYFNWLVADQENYNLGRYGIEGENWIDMGEGTWELPESAAGDPTKRAYYDVYAPLEYEFMNLVWASEPAINAELDAYYRSLPEIVNPLTGFVADYGPIEGINTTDIWGEMYAVAQMARPIEDYDVVIAEFNASGAQEMYDELTRQYQEWKAGQ